MNLAVERLALLPSIREVRGFIRGEEPDYMTAYSRACISFLSCTTLEIFVKYEVQNRGARAA
jgi:hypothetical protein